MPKSPCKNCEERKMYCHSICGKYKEFKKEVERIRQIKYKEYELENAVRDCDRRAVRRAGLF